MYYIFFVILPLLSFIHASVIYCSSLCSQMERNISQAFFFNLSAKVEFYRISFFKGNIRTQCHICLHVYTPD